MFGIGPALLAVLLQVQVARGQEEAVPADAVPTDAAKPFLSADDAILPLMPEEAAAHIGQERTVCGNVGNVTWAQKSRGKPTFINLGRPWPDAVFTILVWEDVRARFETPPEKAFVSARLCVTGLIAEHNGAPQIVLRDPSQITQVER